MALVRAVSTKPEIIVRQIVDGIGYAYEMNARDLPGQPDLVFRQRRKLIFVHGCFWHRHGASTCWRSRIPKTRKEFWVPKLKANVARDRRQVRQLRLDGWQVLIIWECQTGMRKRQRLIARLRKFLKT